MSVNNITKYTRHQANVNVDRKVRYNQVLEVLKGNELTAKQVAVKMYEKGYIPSTERNFTAPRLTELVGLGDVEVIGKTKCQYTGKTVAIYKVV